MRLEEQVSKSLVHELPGSHIRNPGLSVSHILPGGREVKGLHTHHYRRVKPSISLYHPVASVNKRGKSIKFSYLAGLRVSPLSGLCEILYVLYFHTILHGFKAWFYHFLSSLSWWIMSFTS